MALAISLFYVGVLIPQANTLQALMMCLLPGLFALSSGDRATGDQSDRPERGDPDTRFYRA